MSDARALSMAAHPASGRPRKRTLFRLNWAAIVTVIVALLVGFSIGSSVTLGIVNAADPWHGVPQCTDAIADAGGICHGEPLPPCPTEDSDGCYWDAETMGNRRGHDVVTP